MKEAQKIILETLTKRGYRITKARTEVIDAFLKNSKPMTIQVLASRVSSDETSVYRTVATLLKEHLIEEINAQGSVSRYALNHGHYHHVVCQKCDMVVHISCDSEPHVPTLVKGFATIHSHELTFYGLCTKCI